MRSIKAPSLLRMKPKAIERIGKYLNDNKFNRVCVFWGKGIEELLGEKIKEACETSEIEVLMRKTLLSKNVEDCFEAGNSLPKKTEAIVAVGGGLVIDCCKYIAHMTQIPCIVVPTIISNDGFCSSLSSLYVKGRRKTLKTTVPYGVVVDLEVVRKAPEIFLYSGMGDLFCKATALYDWKAAFKKTGEPYDDFAAILTKNALDAFVYYDNKDPKEMDFLRVVASSLLMCGVSMEIAGSSRPASGSEHLISHAYDKVAKQPSLHGIQVGVASYAVSLIQEETSQLVEKAIKECGFLEFVEKNPLSKQDFCEAVKLAPTIKSGSHSIFSEEDAIKRLIHLTGNDSLLKRMLR